MDDNPNSDVVGPAPTRDRIKPRQIRRLFQVRFHPILNFLRPQQTANPEAGGTLRDGLSI
jgi:hypothetical protein